MLHCTPSGSRVVKQVRGTVKEALESRQQQASSTEVQAEQAPPENAQAEQAQDLEDECGARLPEQAGHAQDVDKARREQIGKLRRQAEALRYIFYKV